MLYAILKTRTALNLPIPWISLAIPYFYMKIEALPLRIMIAAAGPADPLGRLGRFAPARGLLNPLETAK